MLTCRQNKTEPWLYHVYHCGCLLNVYRQSSQHHTDIGHAVLNVERCNDRLVTCLWWLLLLKNNLLSSGPWQGMIPLSALHVCPQTECTDLRSFIDCDKEFTYTPSLQALESCWTHKQPIADQSQFLQLQFSHCSANVWLFLRRPQLSLKNIALHGHAHPNVNDRYSSRM